MKKSILQKKLDMMRSLPNCKESKGGSLYIVTQENSVVVEKVFNEKVVTKNTLHQLGTKRKWNQTSRSMILLTKTGKLMLKQIHEQRFTPATIKRLSLFPGPVPALIPQIYFTGRKYEWIKDYPDLWDYRYFTGFPSLREAKVHLGFGFVNDKEFTRVLKVNKSLIFRCRDHQERVNAVALTDSSNYDPVYIDDYINMCDQNGVAPSVPAGWNKLIELHDEQVIKAAEKDMDSLPDQTFTYESDVFGEWEGLTYEVLTTPKQVFIEGKKQQHCLHSYHSRLLYNMFVRFEFGGKLYHAQYAPDGRLHQIYGYKNTACPAELRDKVINPNKHKIKINEETLSLDSGDRDTVDIYEPNRLWDAIPL